MSENLHRLLERQLQRSGVDLMDSPEGREFMKNVNKTYLQFSNEFKVLEKSTEQMLHKISVSNENLKTIIESIDGFNYHVSHDLKNTLINARSLSNMADKYLAKDDLEKVAEVISKLIQTSNSGLNLVEKFLQLSKFESRLVSQDISMIHIPDLIIEIVHELQVTNKFEFDFGEKGFETLKCKEIGLRSLFQNLITNAIKYAQPNIPLKLEINLYEINSNKVIHIKDNGIGIDLEINKDKLFKPFIRIENGLNQEGTGVGLFIVRKVVIEHGGTIKVHSEPNIGTEFIISF